MPPHDHDAILAAVEQIHAAIPLISRTAEQLQGTKAARLKQIDTLYAPGTIPHKLAAYFDKQLTEEQINRLSSSDSPPAFLTWKVVRTDNLLGGLIQVTSATPIARGATADVWQARSRHNDKALVIKYLNPDSVANHEIRVGLALSEMQNLFSIVHRNVVRVYEAGLLQDNQGRLTPFVLMEYLDGCTLEEWRSHHACSPEQAARACFVLGLALHYLHTAKGKSVLHLDLKPSNIMVVGGLAAEATEDTLKLIDFGAPSSSEDRWRIETPAYRAPERSAPAATPTAAWDIYSLGGVLYFLCTGEHPRCNEAGCAAFDLANVKDDSLRAICARALAAPEDRYPSAKELSDDLEDFLNDFPITHASVSYSPQQKFQLLLRRCRKRNDQQDHSRLIGMAFCIFAPLAFILSLSATFMILGGHPVDDSRHFTSNIYRSIVAVVLLALVVMTRHQRVTWQMAAYIGIQQVCYSAMLNILSEQSLAVQAAMNMLIIGLATTYIALGSRTWWFWGVIGPILIGIAVIIPKFASQSWFPAAAPLIQGCAFTALSGTFALHFLTIPQSRPRSSESAIKTQATT